MQYQLSKYHTLEAPDLLLSQQYTDLVLFALHFAFGVVCSTASMTAAREPRAAQETSILFVNTASQVNLQMESLAGKKPTVLTGQFQLVGSLWAAKVEDLHRGSWTSLS